MNDLEFKSQELEAIFSDLADYFKDHKDFYPSLLLLYSFGPGTDSREAINKAFEDRGYSVLFLRYYEKSKFHWDTGAESKFKPHWEFTVSLS